MWVLGDPSYRRAVEEMEEEAGAQEGLSIVAQGGPPSEKKQRGRKKKRDQGKLLGGRTGGHLRPCGH